MEEIKKLISDSNALITQLSLSPDSGKYEELEYKAYFINSLIAEAQRAYVSDQCKLISETSSYRVERVKLFPEYRAKENVKSNDIAEALLDERFASVIKDLQHKEEELKLQSADIDMVDRKYKGIDKQCNFWRSYFFRENSGMNRTK